MRRLRNPPQHVLVEGRLYLRIEEVIDEQDDIVSVCYEERPITTL